LSWSRCTSTARRMVSTRLALRPACRTKRTAGKAAHLRYVTLVIAVTEVLQCGLSNNVEISGNVSKTEPALQARRVRAARQRLLSDAGLGDEMPARHRAVAGSRGSPVPARGRWRR
jgi:hypothetical protein